jgi:hypothetical protein
VTYRNKSDWPVDELMFLLAELSTAASAQRRRGLIYVEIEVVRAQSVKCLLETFRDIGLVGVPQLAGDENVFARDTTILDALADFVLVS